MTEILDLTPAMDLDTELTNGMDNNDDRHPMENELPFFLKMTPAPNSTPHQLCDNPGCAEHHTPLNTPTKNNDNEFPTLPKTASLKRKDNESEFVSPPNRKLSKTKLLHWLLIKILKSISPTNSMPLEIHDSEIDPVEGTSTATSVNNANAVNNKKNPQPMPPLINQPISRRTSPTSNAKNNFRLPRANESDKQLHAKNS
ncbi:hypothetical protein TNCV_4637711 [Trichonephila clavipes]|nr:hypothetical protein TNCV_4637711 [Trichonephila clavipes]